jgi:hypothetical protein
MDLLTDCPCGNIHVNINDCQFDFMRVDFNIGDEHVTITIESSDGTSKCVRILRSDLDRMVKVLS